MRRRELPAPTEVVLRDAITQSGARRGWRVRTSQGEAVASRRLPDGRRAEVSASRHRPPVWTAITYRRNDLSLKAAEFTKFGTADEAVGHVAPPSDNPRRRWGRPAR